MKAIYYTLLSSIALSGCSHFFNGEQKHAHLVDMKLKPVNAKVLSKSGSTVTGNLRFTQKADGVELFVDMKGISPNSTHGFHIHEKGDCSAKDATSAGGHYNPMNHEHGSHNAAKYHLGDLGNIKTDKNGMVQKTIMIKGVSLIEDGPLNILNKGVILHAKADDFTSQPSGNAGSRIACAVIKNN